MTQAFWVVEVGRNSEGISEEGFGRGGVVEFIPRMVNRESDVKIYDHAIDVVVDVPEGVEAVDMQNSFMHNIKNKVRRIRKLPEWVPLISNQ
ncbi:hypothetical protein CsSME_00037369 [Camellia sinensis var. sinensis]